MTHTSTKPVVVVGTDGSDTATEAVRRAAEIVRSRGGQLHLVTVLDDSARSPLTEDVPGEFLRSAGTPGARADGILKRTTQSVAEGLDVATHVESGDVVDVLTRVADAVAADVIVVGNRRPALMPKFIAGSIADRLTHQARCDVLVVHTEGAAA